MKAVSCVYRSLRSRAATDQRHRLSSCGTGELSRKLADLQVKVACFGRELLSYAYVTYLFLRIVSNNILLSLYSCGLAIMPRHSAKGKSRTQPTAE